MFKTQFGCFGLLVLVLSVCIPCFCYGFIWTVKFVVLLFCLKKGGLLVVYFAFLKSIVPSGVVVTYVKSASMSFFASSFSF